jgi:hypothetical protein
MEQKELKEKVRVILTSLQKINPVEISKQGGLMDFDKLGEHPEIKKAVNELNELGVNREYLLKNFFIAGMTMGHLLK